MVSLFKRSPKPTSVSSPAPSPPSDTDSIRSSSQSSISSKSVRFRDSEDALLPGQYAFGSPKSSPKSALKSALKSSQSVVVTLPSLFDMGAAIEEANKVIDTIICDLVLYVKFFKCPSELDFSACPEDPMLLVNNDINKPFITQLKRLSELQMQLARVPTHGDEVLKKQHAAATKAIATALQRMKEKQLELYKKFTTPVTPESAIDNITTELSKFVKEFKHPTVLQFYTSVKNTLIPSPKNGKFIEQLRQLDSLKETLNRIPVDRNEQLMQKRRAASVAIGACRQMLKRCQRDLYERSLKAYKPTRPPGVIDEPEYELGPEV